MPRNIILLFSLVLALGCTIESPPAATNAHSAPEMAVPAGDADESWTITGEVVDENGALVEAFEAAATWSSNGVYWNESGIVPSDADGGRNIWKKEGVLAARPANLATVISKGTFSLAIRDRPRAPVFVVNKDHTYGGLALVERSAADRPVRIELTPLVRVTAEIYCPELGQTPEWVKANVYVVGDNIDLTKCGSFHGRVSFLLPAGEYEIKAHSDSPDLNSRGIQFSIPQGVAKFDLGVIDLVLPRDTEGKTVNITEFYGKCPPDLEITDARGVPKDVKLEDFHGKWVLLEFWAVWCGPCVGTSLPELREFYDRHAAVRNRFEILAICDTSSNEVRTIEEFEVLSADIVKNVWGGKQLPFPVLLDGEGRTSKAFGVLRRPTLFLIDPEGNLVVGGDPKMLADRLRDRD